MPELPDWLRAVALIGMYGTTPLPIAVDASGQLYIVLTGAPDVTIPGNVNTVDLNTVKQIQGTDGSAYRTAKVDANGQFIMVPRGASGNYMSVDASGFLSAILKGLKPDASLGSVAVDANGQLVMVPRGSSGNYMLVDAAGFLTAVLKGDFGGALKTIAVDDAGRMVGVMANVSSAWGYTQNQSLADLAASLRPIQRWDHRGQILEAVDFENGIPPQLGCYAAGGETWEIDPHYSQGSRYCLHVTTVAGANSSIYFTQEFRITPFSRFGSEVAIALPTQQMDVRLALTIYNGSAYYQAKIRWDVLNSTLYYYNSAGAQVPLSAACRVRAGTGIYNHLKLVADFTTNKFMRVLVNEQAFAIPTIDLYTAASSLAPHMEFYLYIGSTYAIAYNVYVDDWVITGEEPA